MVFLEILASANYAGFRSDSHIFYCMPYSYITIANMHIHKHYIGAVQNSLRMYVRLNREGKIPNTLWTIMCTYSIDYNCFNLSKIFIKIYSTDISIATVYLYCFWILRALFPTYHTLTRHLLAVFFSQLCPFPQQNH